MQADHLQTSTGLGPTTHLPSTGGKPASLEARSYDHWHVDLHERWEVDFWMKHLDCDERSLRDAIFHVGARVGAVRAWLASHPNRA